MTDCNKRDAVIMVKPEKPLDHQAILSDAFRKTLTYVWVYNLEDPKSVFYTFYSTKPPPYVVQMLRDYRSEMHTLYLKIIHDVWVSKVHKNKKSLSFFTSKLNDFGPFIDCTDGNIEKLRGTIHSVSNNKDMFPRPEENLSIIKSIRLLIEALENVKHYYLRGGDYREALVDLHYIKDDDADVKYFTDSSDSDYDGTAARISRLLN